MIAVKEITVWDDVKRQPNHIYLMEGSKAIAYMPFGEGKPFYFKNGITLDKRGRKFEELKKNPFKEVKVESTVVKVQGSKGNTYEVDVEARTCTCPGFQYRGNCKHVEEHCK